MRCLFVCLFVHRTPDNVARVKSLTKCCLNDTNLERMPNELGRQVVVVIISVVVVIVVVYSLVNLQVLEARENVLTELPA